MPIAPAMLVPLASGLGYAVAALMLKRGSEGAGPWRVTFIVNWVIAIVFSLGWLFPSAHPISWSNVGHASISAVLFFIGQIFTFPAVSRGDVSVATPVLGSKVVFVALLTVFFGLDQFNTATWLAVALTLGATALLGSSGGTVERGAVLRSILYGFGAAVSFAFNDLTQQRWIPLWDVVPYMAALFQVMALISLILIPLFRNDGRTVSRANWRWLAGGATLISIQASGVAWAIVALGATVANVLYNSRGVWSVVLVWWVGHWFGNTESGRGPAIMLRRLGGALLLLSAIFLLTRR